MRKLLIASLMSIAATVLLCPDIAATAGISAGGMKGGLSLARQNGVRLFPDHRVGLGAGVFAEIPITQVISAQIELLYVMKGGASPQIDLIDMSGNPISTVRIVHKVDYLELPLLARVRVPVQGPVAPTFVVGPSLAYKLSEKYSPPEVGVDEDFPGGGNLSSTDLGFAFGAGVELGRGRRRWLIEARYTFGVTNTVRDPDARSVRNGNFLLMSGYSLRP